MPTLLHRLDVTWRSGRECPLVMHYLADLQSVHGLRCYGNITRTRNVSVYMLVLALCIVSDCRQFSDVHKVVYSCISRLVGSLKMSYYTFSVAQMGDRLSITDMGRKLGAVPLWGELGPNLTQSRLGQGLPPTKWHLNPSNRLATIDMDRKLGAVPPFFGGSCVPISRNVAGAEMYLRAKFHLDPFSRLDTMHQRYRQTGQDRQTGQRSDSIGWTVLQTVAQNGARFVKLRVRYDLLWDSVQKTENIFNKLDDWFWACREARIMPTVFSCQQNSVT